jgi:hypothetical protein
MIIYQFLKNVLLLLLRLLLLRLLLEAVVYTQLNDIQYMVGIMYIVKKVGIHLKVD